MNLVIWNIVTVFKHKIKIKIKIRDFILAIFQTCIRFACIFKNTEDEYWRYAWKVSKAYFILGIYNSLLMLKSLSCIPLRGKRPHRRCALVRPRKNSSLCAHRAAAYRVWKRPFQQRVENEWEKAPSAFYKNLVLLLKLLLLLLILLVLLLKLLDILIQENVYVSEEHNIHMLKIINVKTKHTERNTQKQPWKLVRLFVYQECELGFGSLSI